MQQTVVKTYRGRERDASKDFQRDAERMAAKGYQPVSQNYAPGAYGCGSFILALLLCFVFIGFIIFVYMLIVKPAGTLTVTYALVGPVPAGAPAQPESGTTKTCPECAEEVKAAATKCRFCGFLFPAMESVVVRATPLEIAGTPQGKPTATESRSHSFGRQLGELWAENWFRWNTYTLAGLCVLVVVGDLMTPKKEVVPAITSAQTAAQPAVVPSAPAAVTRAYASGEVTLTIDAAAAPAVIEPASSDVAAVRRSGWRDGSAAGSARP